MKKLRIWLFLIALFACLSLWALWYFRIGVGEQLNVIPTENTEQIVPDEQNPPLYVSLIELFPTSKDFRFGYRAEAPIIEYDFPKPPLWMNEAIKPSVFESWGIEESGTLKAEYPGRMPGGTILVEIARFTSIQNARTAFENWLTENTPEHYHYLTQPLLGDIAFLWVSEITEAKLDAAFTQSDWESQQDALLIFLQGNMIVGVKTKVFFGGNAKELSYFIGQTIENNIRYFAYGEPSAPELSDLMLTLHDVPSSFSQTPGAIGWIDNHLIAQMNNLRAWSNTVQDALFEESAEAPYLTPLKLLTPDYLLPEWQNINNTGRIAGYITQFKNESNPKCEVVINYLEVFHSNEQAHQSFQDVLESNPFLAENYSFFGADLQIDEVPILDVGEEAKSISFSFSDSQYEEMLELAQNLQGASEETFEPCGQIYLIIRQKNYLITIISQGDTEFLSIANLKVLGQRLSERIPDTSDNLVAPLLVPEMQMTPLAPAP